MLFFFIVVFAFRLYTCHRLPLNIGTCHRTRARALFHITYRSYPEGIIFGLLGIVIARSSSPPSPNTHSIHIDTHSLTVLKQKYLSHTDVESGLRRHCPTPQQHRTKKEAKLLWLLLDCALAILIATRAAAATPTPTAVCVRADCVFFAPRVRVRVYGFV